MQHDNRRRHRRRSLVDLTSDTDLLYEENPSLEMLENLHSDSNARSLLAANTNCTVEILEHLADDGSDEVRAAVAGNKNITFKYIIYNRNILHMIVEQTIIEKYKHTDTLVWE